MERKKVVEENQRRIQQAKEFEALVKQKKESEYEYVEDTSESTPLSPEQAEEERGYQEQLQQQVAEVEVHKEMSKKTKFTSSNSIFKEAQKAAKEKKSSRKGVYCYACKKPFKSTKQYATCVPNLFRNSLMLLISGGKIMKSQKNTNRKWECFQSRSGYEFLGLLPIELVVNFCFSPFMLPNWKK